MMNARLMVLPTVAALVFCAGALGQVDPAAKQLIEESVKSMQESKSIAFKVSQTMPGPSGSAGDGSVMNVKMLRGDKAAPLKINYTGDLMIFAEGKKKVSVLIEHMDQPAPPPAQIRRRITWVDDGQKKVLTQQTGNGSGADVWVARCERNLLGPYEPNGKNPFENELRARKIEIVEAKEVDGQPCQVIKITMDDQNERTLILGTVDKLPRFFEQRRGKIARSWTFSEVSDKDLTDKDLEVAVPAGYKKEVMPDPVPPAPKAPTAPTTPTMPATPATPAAQPADPSKVAPNGDLPEPKPQGMRLTPGGLRPGAEVPAFELAGVDGKTVRMADLKGKTTVLAFWGPQFDSSGAVAQAVNDFAKVNAGSVNAVGVACRLVGDNDVNAVKQFWTEKNFAFTGALNGDDLASRLNVRGFPSVMIIDAEGKAKAFFEGAVTAEMITSAVSAK